MPGFSKQTAPRDESAGPVENHSGEVGEYTIDFLTAKADLDGAPLLKGLPGDLCQCPHWGYVLSGRITFVYPDRQESSTAGDAFYAPPGHSPFWGAGSEFVNISPTDEVRVVSDHLKNAIREMAGRG